MSTVALLIDLQVDFFTQARLMANRQGLIANLNALTAMLRSVGCPVIWVTQSWAADLHDAPPDIRKRGIRVVIDGTPGAALLPELIHDAADLRIVKRRYSAFFRTDLDERLRSIDATRLIIAGVNTHACVRATVVDAYQRDFDILLAADCIDSYDAEHHKITMRYLDGRLASAVTNSDLTAEMTKKPLRS